MAIRVLRNIPAPQIRLVGDERIAEKKVDDRIAVARINWYHLSPRISDFT
jgi:hypothetical protein